MDCVQNVRHPPSDAQASDPNSWDSNDVAVGSAIGAVNTHVPLYFPLETGSARFMLIPIPRSKCKFNSQMVRSVAKLGEGPKPTTPRLGGGTLLGKTFELSRSTLMVLSPYRDTSHISPRPLPFNLNQKWLSAQTSSLLLIQSSVSHCPKENRMHHRE